MARKPKNWPGWPIMVSDLSGRTHEFSGTKRNGETFISARPATWHPDDDATEDDSVDPDEERVALNSARINLIRAKFDAACAAVTGDPREDDERTAASRQHSFVQGKIIEFLRLVPNGCPKRRIQQSLSRQCTPAEFKEALRALEELQIISITKVIRSIRVRLLAKPLRRPTDK